MSSTVGATAILLTATVTATAYFTHMFSFPMQKEKDRLRIQELEEEIVRLKREMRICGIRTSSWEGEKDSS